MGTNNRDNMDIDINDVNPAYQEDLSLSMNLIYPISLMYPIYLISLIYSLSFFER